MRAAAKRVQPPRMRSLRKNLLSATCSPPYSHVTSTLAALKHRARWMRRLVSRCPAPTSTQTRDLLAPTSDRLHVQTPGWQQKAPCKPSLRRFWRVVSLRARIHEPAGYGGCNDDHAECDTHRHPQQRHETLTIEH